MQLHIAPVSFDCLARAVVLAYDYREAVYDAAFIAPAESLGAQFITADEELVRRLSSLPFVRFLGQVVAI